MLMTLLIMHWISYYFYFKSVDFGKRFFKHLNRKKILGKILQHNDLYFITISNPIQYIIKTYDNHSYKILQFLERH